MSVFQVVFPAVMALDLIVPFLVAIPYRGYSHRRSAMSVLGSPDSPLARVYSLWTIVSGLVFLWAACVVPAQFQASTGLRVTLGVLLGLYGLGCEIVSGLFPVQADKQDMTTSAKIHGVGSVIGFLAMLFAPLVLGMLQFRTGAAALGIVSLASFALALVTFVLFVMADKPQFRDTVIGYEGLWQRLALAFMYLPFFVWAVSWVAA